MTIQTKAIKIKFQKPLELDFIKKEIEKLGISPVRFGITSVENDVATVSISYIS